MVEFIIYLSIGILAGMSAGLFGLGGGVIVVPALVLVYQWNGIHPDSIMHIAVSTSLMTIVVTSLSSAYSHYKYQHIDWSVVLMLTPSLLIGAFMGSYIAVSLSSDVLQYIFIIYMIVAAIKIWLPISEGYSLGLLNKPQLWGFGTLAGGLSVLLGSGGGTLIVPYLVSAKLSIKQAIGTASACGFPIALAAVIGFLFLGDDAQLDQAVSWQTGFIDWKAFVGIIIASIYFARVGAYLAKCLPITILKRIFSILLIVVAIEMWLKMA